LCHIEFNRGFTQTVNNQTGLIVGT
jgi:hypothetical protein